MTLSNASSGALTDATATGTITNHDALPAALTARFGRAAAVHVLEQVEERVNAPRAPGFDGRFAGRRINRNMGRDFALELLQGVAGNTGLGPGGLEGASSGRPGVGGVFGLRPEAGFGLQAPGHLAGAAGMEPHGGLGTLGGAGGGGGFGMGFGGRDQILGGSSFALNREAAGGSLGFWSRSASSSFAGREDALALGGDVRTTMFGADYSRDRMITGISLSHSRGLGTYAGDGAEGQVASAVTGLYPWIGFKPSERVTVWTVAGYSAGGLRLDHGGGGADRHRAVDGHDRRRRPRRDRRQRRRLRAGVQGRRPVGRHVDRGSLRPRWQPRFNARGRQPRPHRDRRLAEPDPSGPDGTDTERRSGHPPGRRRRGGRPRP